MEEYPFDLLEVAKTSNEKILKSTNSRESGLNDQEVEIAREKYGKNILRSKKKKSNLKLLAEAFLDPFTILLFAISIISLFTDYILSEDNDLSSFIIIMAMLLISGTLQFIQEKKSYTSAEKLSQMVKSSIIVKRNNKKIEIPIDDIVVGDLVFLSSGDLVPADLRILKSTDLFIGQSSLTGESEPIEKFSGIDLENTSKLDLNNIAFMGTNVISGTAEAVVINVGKNTVIGGIAKTLDDKPIPTSFDREINTISLTLIKLMFVVVPLVFVLNGFHTKNWLDSFIFAITIAVGMTPAMLPTVVSVNLSRNANDLSKRKVIVKNLSAIQNLGSMDILCTDKTGTLTQDKVTMMHAFNTSGEEDLNLLKYAYLNSYFQTGLRNLMDEAIIEYTHKHLEETDFQSYNKVNEIPFDFSRRRMTVVVDNGKENILITKGAVEELSKISKYDYNNGNISLIEDSERKQYLNQVLEYNKEGFRVIALGFKKADLSQDSFSIEDENDLVLLGFLAFLDPPKESSKEAVKKFYESGVDIKVLTGDNPAITKIVCDQVGIPTENIIIGSQIDDMDENTLTEKIKETSIFAKLSPEQKLRVVKNIQAGEDTVGYMGDGINDAASLRQADVGISVDTAVDIAKESANIILLEKDLTVLIDGILYGRRSHVNIMKYIKATISANFGYMLTMLISGIVLPFFPMLPMQLLVFNLIYDVTALAIPWDKVDDELITNPSKGESLSLNRFMTRFGPITTIADMITFGLLFFVLIPNLLGSSYAASDKNLFTSIFQTSWFVSSLWTQSILIHLVRTERLPFIQSRASLPVIAFSFGGALLGTILPFTKFGRYLKLVEIPTYFLAVFIVIFIIYVVLNLLVKKFYLNKYEDFL